MTNSFLELFAQKPMVLIMSLPGNNPALARAAFLAGADAVKVHVNVRHFASGSDFGDLDSQRAEILEMLAEARGPMGVVPGDTLARADEALDGVCALPFSFISLYTKHTPVRLLNMSVAKMLALDAEYTLWNARALKGVGADVLEASILPHEGYGKPLSAHDLLAYHALCAQTELPVVVPSQRKLVPADVRALYRAGVRGVMIGAVVTGDSEESMCAAISAFRAQIDTL